MLIDKYGRKIEYLRISVTDRCNFRCIYCGVRKNWKWLPHNEILTFEEIEKIVEIGVKLGIKRVRLTGGEPLLRKDIEILIKKLSKIPEIEDLSLTTNGFFLEFMAEKLKKAGLKRINISLDTLNPEKFIKITGVDGFSKVWQGIKKALKLGFDPVKINVVIIKGINDDEILDLAKLTLDMPLEIRFIEFMPIEGNGIWDKKNIFTIKEIKNILEKFKPLIRTISSGGGPARVWKWENAKGKIGFISPISDCFCEKCNRLRITPDGKLKPCLFSNHEIDLKPILRENRGSLEKAFIEALKIKPKNWGNNFIAKPMNLIGG